MTKTILVVAGNYDQFLRYIKERKIERDRAVYLNRPEKILGLRDFEVHLAYEWWNSPGLEALDTYLQDLNEGGMSHGSKTKDQAGPE